MENSGQYTVTADPNARTAADIKDAVRMFHSQFSFDELRQIPVVPVGTPLKQGAVYLDLAARESGPRVAHGPATARVDQLLVPKHEVPYELWNRLVNDIH